jgi:hypothetical protein
MRRDMARWGQDPTTMERIMGTRFTIAITIKVVMIVAQKPLDFRKLISGSAVHLFALTLPRSLSLRELLP